MGIIKLNSNNISICCSGWQLVASWIVLHNQSSWNKILISSRKQYQSVYAWNHISLCIDKVWWLTDQYWINLCPRDVYRPVWLCFISVTGEKLWPDRISNQRPFTNHAKLFITELPTHLVISPATFHLKPNPSYI